MEDIVIEKLSEIDAEFVCEIESELIKKTDVSKIKNTISSETLSYYVLKKEGNVIGFFECFILPPEAELYDIAIKKEFQGKGFASLLMNHFISIAKAYGCETIFLEVNNINKVAISLYNKFGFEVYNTRKNYYGENEDAILMKKSLI